MYCISLENSLVGTKPHDWSNERIRLWLCSFLLDNGYCREVEEFSYLDTVRFEESNELAYSVLTNSLAYCLTDRLRVKVVGRCTNTRTVLIEDTSNEADLESR